MMMEKCALQCTTHGCADVHWKCWSWAAAGMCAADPGFMLLHCRKSCDQCIAGPGPKRQVPVNLVVPYDYVKYNPSYRGPGQSVNPWAVDEVLKENAEDVSDDDTKQVEVTTEDEEIESNPDKHSKIRKLFAELEKILKDM